MKRWKIIVIIPVLGFAIIQLLPSKLPESVANNPNDLLANNLINDSVALLLKSTCYDCHSNITVYPWYSYVAPVSWLVGRDTKIGREHLNFSEWESYSMKQKLKALTEIAEVVESKEMPMPIYQIIHTNARISKEERMVFINWTEQFSDQLLE